MRPCSRACASKQVRSGGPSAAVRRVGRVLKAAARMRTAVGVFAISVSSLYHFCEPTGYRIYGMNDGQWHRLDNIGA
jgi:hypothetical protein